MIVRATLVGALLIFSQLSAEAAPTCDQFKAAITAGATHYNAPTPQFQVDHTNTFDTGTQFWTIKMFSDARGALSCSQGVVERFAADAISGEMIPSAHLVMLMGIGLYGYGLDWRSALELRDHLLHVAEETGLNAVESPIDGSRASFAISVAGVPSFEIETGRSR